MRAAKTGLEGGQGAVSACGLSPSPQGPGNLYQLTYSWASWDITVFPLHLFTISFNKTPGLLVSIWVSKMKIKQKGG